MRGGGGTAGVRPKAQLVSQLGMRGLLGLGMEADVTGNGRTAWTKKARP